MSDILYDETRNRMLAEGRPELYVDGRVRSDLHLEGAAWIYKYCEPVSVAVHDREVVRVRVSVSQRGRVIFTPDVRSKIRLGDVILFSGQSYIHTGNRVTHSSIATGRGTEVSHKWWNRQIQAERVAKEPWLEPTDVQSYDPANDYPVTRDLIDTLVLRFTDSENTTYYFDEFTIYRIKDVRLKDRTSLESLLTATWP